MSTEHNSLRRYKPMALGMLLSMITATNVQGSVEYTEEELDKRARIAAAQGPHEYTEKELAERVERFKEKYSKLSKMECPAFTVSDLRELQHETYSERHPITVDGSKWGISPALSNITPDRLAHLDEGSHIERLNTKPVHLHGSRWPEFCQLKITHPNGISNKLTLIYVD